MRYLSLFSGIEAASVAWHPLGWEPVAFSEIDPFPCAVLDYRFPNVPNWGDITKYKEWPDACLCPARYGDPMEKQSDNERREGERARNIIAPRPDVYITQRRSSRSGDNPGYGEENNNGTTESLCAACGGLRIDLIVGGSPCQAFSIAGLRQGLGDPRGNLMLTYLAVVKKYRPGWVVWENVPGVLSSNGGRDFATFLGGLGQCGYGFAYRILDTQYVRTREFPRAIPQRRRRVFVVGCLGDWRRAAAVLSIGQSVSWDSPPRRKTSEGVAGTVKGGSGERGYPGPSDGNGGGLVWASTVDTVDATNNVDRGDSQHLERLIVARESGKGYWMETDVSGTIDANLGQSGTGVNRAGIMTVYENHPQDSRVREMGDVCTTVDARSVTGGGNVPLVAESLLASDYKGPGHNRDHNLVASEVAPTLSSSGMGTARVGFNSEEQWCVTYRIDSEASNSMKSSNPNSGFVECDIAKTLDTTGTDPNKAQGGNVIAMRWREKKEGGGKGGLFFDNHTGTLATNNDQTIFVSAFKAGQGAKAGGLGESFEVSPSLTSAESGTNQVPALVQVSPSLTASNDPSRSPRSSEVTQQVASVYAASMAVRRLTPTECERLQGFPDGYTKIPYRGKGADSCPDGPRYKALGNSMSTNVMGWIGQRIQFVEEICAELEDGTNE